MNQDLTTGKADRVLWKFCLPLFGSILFQQLYNIADSFVAGKFINNNALAAVGNSYEITLIFLAFAFGCNIGCSVLVAQLFGAKRYNDVRTVIYTTLIASGALCILLMVLGTCFCDQLLELIHTPKELFDASKKYLDIYIYSLPFVFYYNVIMLQPGFSPRSAIPKRRFISWPAPPSRISAWTSSLSPNSICTWRVWPGPLHLSGHQLSAGASVCRSPHRIHSV